MPTLTWFSSRCFSTTCELSSLRFLRCDIEAAQPPTPFSFLSLFQPDFGSVLKSRSCPEHPGSTRIFGLSSCVQDTSFPTLYSLICNEILDLHSSGVLPAANWESCGTKKSSFREFLKMKLITFGENCRDFGTSLYQKSSFPITSQDQVFYNGIGIKLANLVRNFPGVCTGHSFCFEIQGWSNFGAIFPLPQKNPTKGKRTAVSGGEELCTSVMENMICFSW